MNKIPTAHEFVEKENYPESLSGETLHNVMIEFAKLHVEIALKNAYDCGTFKGWAISDDENDHKEIFVKNIMSRQAIK